MNEIIAISIFLATGGWSVGIGFLMIGYALAESPRREFYIGLTIYTLLSILNGLVLFPLLFNI